MPNSKDVFNWVVSQISLDEPHDEIKSIAYLLLEYAFKISKARIVAGDELGGVDQAKLATLINRINQGEPIQYIIGEQHFYGRIFKVTPAVLVPRPETEHLIDSVLEYTKALNAQKLRILDIGTGSGCLAITLLIEVKNAEVIGTDVSEQALRIAAENNQLHNTSVNFILNNVLESPLPEGKFDLIISNPPYITEREKSNMMGNVLNFEPHSALFVHNSDPLIFYKAILSKGIKQLNNGGMLVVEINERYGSEVSSLFEKMRFHEIEIIKDLQGKERVVKGLAKN